MNRSKMKFACNYEKCTSVFRKRSHYECHLRMHSGERPFICADEDCDKSYRRLSHLQRHEKTHDSKYNCSFPGCAKILSSKETYKKHVRIIHHTKEHKKYKCSECDQTFTKHKMLQAHSYIHSGKLLYECTEPNCDRSFCMPSLLKRHMKRHKGYCCDKPDCLKIFPRWSLLLKHKRECHPKVFKCSICNKEFNFACNLKAHSLIHKDEREIFKCTVPKCVRFYQAKRHLADHLKYFHDTHPFSCPKDKCSRFFKSKNEMQKHILWRHVPRSVRKGKATKEIYKPDFTNILAGYAKGTKKDLNPQLSKETSELLLELHDDADNEEKTLKTNDANPVITSKLSALKDINDTNNFETINQNLENSPDKISVNEILNYNCELFSNPVWNSFAVITGQIT